MSSSIPENYEIWKEKLIFVTTGVEPIRYIIFKNRDPKNYFNLKKNNDGTDNTDVGSYINIDENGRTQRKDDKSISYVNGVSLHPNTYSFIKTLEKLQEKVFDTKRKIPGVSPTSFAIVNNNPVPVSPVRGGRRKRKTMKLQKNSKMKSKKNSKKNSNNKK
jgi:hypothetical protein